MVAAAAGVKVVWILDGSRDGRKAESNGDRVDNDGNANPPLTLLTKAVPVLLLLLLPPLPLPVTLPLLLLLLREDASNGGGI